MYSKKDWYIQISIMQPLVKRSPETYQIARICFPYLLKCDFTELACLQPLPPTEKNYRRRGDFLLDIIISYVRLGLLLVFS